MAIALHKIFVRVLTGNLSDARMFYCDRSSYCRDRFVNDDVMGCIPATTYTTLFMTTISWDLIAVVQALTQKMSLLSACTYSCCCGGELDWRNIGDGSSSLSIQDAIHRCTFS
jgi:hypothetical protein